MTGRGRRRAVLGAALVVAMVLSSLAGRVGAEPQEQLPAAVNDADGKIATEIERRLTVDKEVNATAVELDVHAGVVTMTGRVPSEAAKARAEKIAASVTGVSKVNNRLSAGTAEPGAPGGAGTIPERIPER
jgi:osmotically-inducible protein OsmY